MPTRFRHYVSVKPSFVWTITATLLLGLPTIEAQILIIPQVADGNGWQTEFVLANTTTSPLVANMTCFEDTVDGATQSWALATIEGSNLQNIVLTGGATFFLHTPGTATVTSTGWCQIQAGTGLAAYAVFTQKVAGRQTQDGTATAAPVTSRAFVPFDETSGFVTTLGLVNPSNAYQNVNISVQTDYGAISYSPQIALPPQGHLGFMVPSQIQGTAGQRGMLELSSSGGLGVLALRFNPTGAFTASPVYPTDGSAVIGQSGTVGGLPTFSILTITSNNSSIGQEISWQVSPAGNSMYLLQSQGVTFPQSDNLYTVIIDTPGTLSNQTFSFSALNRGFITNILSDAASMTAFSLGLSLTPLNSTTGTVTGNIVANDSAVALTYSFTGTYVMTP